MQVFVSEYVCGGAWPGVAPEGSLRAEGEAMLAAVAADFARINGCRVVTTWDRRLGRFPLDGIEVVSPCDAPDELACFSRLAAESDATLVIAPEFHDILAKRCDEAQRVGARLLGPGSAVVRLCGDKRRLAGFLAEQGLPVIPTHALSVDSIQKGEPLPWPIVIKPCCGAGAINTFLVGGPEAMADRWRRGMDPPDLPPDVWQPYVPGRALSVSAIVSSGHCVDLFPTGDQHMLIDRAESVATFAYAGGRIPAPQAPTAAIAGLVRAACAALGEGLNGYIGFDLILPNADEPTAPLAEQRVAPVLVEINPRLTTSYIGYRALTEDNLAERMLSAAFGRADVRPIRWKPGPVEFASGGTVSRVAD